MSLRNRLTNSAEAELLALQMLLQDFQLSNGPDSRRLLDGRPFSSRGIYKALMQNQPATHLDIIWQTAVPKKVQIFTWLLCQNRLNTRANLL